MMNHLAAIHSLLRAKHASRLGTLLAMRLTLPVLLYFSASALIQLTFHLAPWTILPLLWDALMVLAVFAALAIAVDTLIVHRPDLHSTARLLEQRSKTAVPHPLLAIALELGKSTGDGNELHAEVLRRGAQQTPAFSRISALPALPRTLFPALFAAALFLVASVLLNPKLISYWQLPFTMASGAEGQLSPGTLRVPLGASVHLRLVPDRLIAPACQLVITRNEGAERTERFLRDDGHGAFSYEIDSLSSSFSYRFRYGGTTFGPESVLVQQPPYVKKLQVVLHPPSYTGQREHPLPPGQGDFAAFEGTRVSIAIESSTLKGAALRLDETTVPLTISGTTASGFFTLSRATSYTFDLVDTFSQRSDTSHRYTIGLFPDEPPSVRFLRPGNNRILQPAQRESLLVEATDDLGVRTCRLHWFKSGDDRSVPPSQQDLSPATPQPRWQKEFLWNISRLSLYPGDTLFYWAGVTDSRPAPRSITSDTFFFRLPTIDEIHRAMAASEDGTLSNLSSAIKRQDDIAKQVERLDKATAPRSNSGTWERKQLARNIEEAMQAQADSLQNAINNLEETIRQLSREGDIGETIAKKMDEVRKAMKELAEMYGDSLLFPKDSTGELSADDLRQAVEKLNAMLPELSKQLDNTLRFLEQLKRDSELARLAMRAEKLAADQAQLAEKNNNDATAGARQRDLLDRIDALKKDIAQQSAGQQQRPDERTIQQIDSLAAELSKQLAANKSPQSGSMRQMSANLSSLAQQLREQMSDFMARQLEALRNKLLDLAGNSLDIEAWQDQLREGTADTSFDEESYRRNQALSQQAISEAISHLQKQLDSLPMLPPSLQRKLRNGAETAGEMAKLAVRSLGESDGQFGMRMSGQSMRQLAADLLATADALNGQQEGNCSGGACGMRESLRRMSGKQAAINAATAQLLRSMLQGGKKPGENGREGGDGAQNERARKEAQAAQESLAKELKALGEKFGNDGGAEGMKDRIKQLEEEARSLTRMLESPREEVTERQDRFLARMLQSALSLHREEEGKEDRQSTSAGIVFTKTDGALSDSLIGSNDAFLRLRQRALLGRSFPPGYRQAINAYFDSLGVRFLK